MPKQSAATADPPRARRLTAEARRSSILKAARRAFSETGDMNGTTIRHIAEKGGISEGVIYRHFESKDQLFYEAVVEPLQEAFDKLIAATETVDRDEPLTPKRQRETMEALYRQLLVTLEDVLPLLGLVLFGDPQVARKFYRDNLAAAMDRLAAAWREVERRYGEHLDASYIAGRGVIGIALMLALESTHNPKFDRDRAVAQATESTLSGFFHALDPSRKKR